MEKEGSVCSAIVRSGRPLGHFGRRQLLQEVPPAGIAVDKVEQHDGEAGISLREGGVQGQDEARVVRHQDGAADQSGVHSFVHSCPGSCGKDGVVLQLSWKLSEGPQSREGRAHRPDRQRLPAETGPDFQGPPRQAPVEQRGCGERRRPTHTPTTRPTPRPLPATISTPTPSPTPTPTPTHPHPDPFPP